MEESSSVIVTKLRLKLLLARRRRRRKDKSETRNFNDPIIDTNYQRSFLFFFFFPGDRMT